MKKVYIYVLIFLIVIAFPLTVTASDSDFYSNAVDEILEQTPDESKKLLESFGISDFTIDEINNVNFNDIIKMVLSIFEGSLKKPFEMLILLTEISIICAVCSCFILNSSVHLIFESISVIVISLMLFSSLNDCITRISVSLVSVCTLMKVLIPIIAAIATFSGNPTLAISYNAVTVYASEIIAAVCSDFLAPILINLALLAICLTFNTFVKGDSVIDAAKKFINMLLGLCASVFTGISGIKNLLSAGADRVSVKGIQFLLGSSVPVVGGALSDGLSSVIATVELMKSTFGIIGIIIIIIIVLPVTCELILWNLSVSSASYICGILGQTKAASVLSSLKFIITTLMSIILFCTYIFIVSTGMVILMGSN